MKCLNLDVLVAMTADPYPSLHNLLYSTPANTGSNFFPVLVYFYQTALHH